ALAYRSAAPHWPPSPSDAAGHTARAQPAPPCHPQRPGEIVMTERLTNDATVDAALDALRASATTGEIFLREAQSGSVEIKEGAVEAVIARGERGIGVRVLDDQRLGFAYTSDLSLNGIRECADTARRMSALTERDAQRAVEKLGAKPLATQKVPVVLDPWMAMDLLRAIGPLFSADNVLKGRSLFADKIGQRVANEKVTIVDDARRPRGLRSAPFDGEGVATATRTLIENGVLRGYLTSLKTARKLGTESTGNARRGGYGSPARIGPSNLFVAAGSDEATA